MNNVTKTIILMLNLQEILITMDFSNKSNGDFEEITLKFYFKLKIILIFQDISEEKKFINISQSCQKRWFV